MKTPEEYWRHFGGVSFDTTYKAGDKIVDDTISIVNHDNATNCLIVISSLRRLDNPDAKQEDWYLTLNINNIVRADYK